MKMHSLADNFLIASPGLDDPHFSQAVVLLCDHAENGAFGLNGAILGMKRSEIERKYAEIVEFSEVEEFIDTPVKRYSLGMQVKLAFSVATSIESEILIVDELLAVGDVQYRLKCFNHILQLIAKGVSLIFVSHSMIDVNRVCRSEVYATESSLSGSGVETLSVRTQSSNGWITSTFSSGDELEIALTVDCRDTLRHARFWLAIHSEPAGLIAGFSTVEDKFPITLLKGSTEYILKIPTLPLGIGHYRVSCGVYGPEIEPVYEYQESS